uniref:Glyco_tran_10_N domain-containing protein n=1 Tax=Panagrellus redivivus TaxID=6233 RepID=A0A7E4W8D6_PANRE
MGTTPRRRSYLFNVVIFIITYVLISATYNYYASSYLKNYLTFPTVVRFLPPFSTEHQNQCELPKLDPWDPTILDFVKPYNVYKTDPKFKVFTKLENGILTKTFNDSRRECSYRCMFSVNDRKLRYGDWIDIGNDTMPECDVVETKCFSTKAKKKPDFEYMHAQIYRNDTKSETDKNQIPNVHIIVIDSMSHSALLRTMPKTVETLKSDFAAIPFPHLNKIGANSRPNAFGFLLAVLGSGPSSGPDIGHFRNGYVREMSDHLKLMYLPIEQVFLSLI